MATFQLPARRLILAGGFAIAVALAPVAADLTADPLSHTLAACVSNKSGGSYSLSCAPDLVPGGNGATGAPTESDLTAKNSHR
jgi:hypothetical protein